MMRQIVDTVFLKDIVEYYNIRDVHFLEELFWYLVDNAGNMINIQNIISYYHSQ